MNACEQTGSSIGVVMIPPSPEISNKKHLNQKIQKTAQPHPLNRARNSNSSKGAAKRSAPSDSSVFPSPKKKPCSPEKWTKLRQRNIIDSPSPKKYEMLNNSSHVATENLAPDLITYNKISLRSGFNSYNDDADGKKAFENYDFDEFDNFIMNDWDECTKHNIDCDKFKSMEVSDHRRLATPALAAYQRLTIAEVDRHVSGQLTLNLSCNLTNELKTCTLKGSW